MPNRPPEEYDPQYDDLLAREWQMVRRDFEVSHGYPIERDYGYVRERYYDMAKANARARARALETPKEQLARQRPVIQRPVYVHNHPPSINYKPEVKRKMFKFTVGWFFGFLAAAVLVVFLAFSLMNNITDVTQNAVNAIVQPGATAVFSNEIVPYPTRPELLNSESNKAASDPIHHEGIELLKERPEGEGRNR
jgi:hypothetical protein